MPATKKTYRNGKAGGHSVQVVGVAAHSHYLGNDLLTCPLYAKHLRQLLQVVCSSLANGEDSVSQPAHAQAAELFVEKFDAKLAGKQWDILDNGETHSPLLIFGQLDDGRQQ